MNIAEERCAHLLCQGKTKHFGGKLLLRVIVMKLLMSKNVDCEESVQCKECLLKLFSLHKHLHRKFATESISYGNAYSTLDDYMHRCHELYIQFITLYKAD